MILYINNHNDRLFGEIKNSPEGELIFTTLVKVLKSTI